MITFENVTKRYPGGTIAVDDLSLEVPRGQIVAVLGAKFKWARGAGLVR